MAVVGDVPEIKEVDDFCLTEDYEEAKAKLESGNILVLYGQYGSGKTEISKRLIRDKVSSLGRDVMAEMINFSSKSVLKAKLEYLKSSSGSYLIIHHNENLKDFPFAILSQHKHIKTVITTRDTTYDWQRDEKGWTRFANHYNVTGFSPKEIVEFLDAGDIDEETLKEAILNITNLPQAWRNLKIGWQRTQLSDVNNFLARHISDLQNISRYNTEPFCRITANIKKALFSNPEGISLLKHLVLFDHNDITADMLLALMEEWDPKKNSSFADDLLGCLMEFNLCRKTITSSNVILFSFHQSVFMMIKNIDYPPEVERESEEEVLRRVMQAFSRISPKDGRNNGLPCYLEHAKRLCENCKKILEGKDLPFLQLLLAELYTSIGYSMLVLKYEGKDIMKFLHEGKTIFETRLVKMAGDRSSVDPETDPRGFIELLTMSSYLKDDKDYNEYIKTLQLMRRLTPKEFESIFTQKWIKFHPYLRNNHLTEPGLDRLRKMDELLPFEKLRELYPLELYTYHLHLLSKTFLYMHETNVAVNPSDKPHYENAVKMAKVAEKIYGLIEKRKHVKLTGSRVNIQFYLFLKMSGAENRTLEKQRVKWKEMRDEWASAYECGIVRIRDISKDDCNRLLCMENELEVTGLIMKQDGRRREKLKKNGNHLIQEIEKLAQILPNPALNLSKSYEKFGRYWLNLTEYKKATENVVDSLVKYREYSAGETFKVMATDAHPELDEGKIGKFTAIYELLINCLDGLYREVPDYIPNKDYRYDYLKTLLATGRAGITGYELVQKYLTMDIQLSEQAGEYI